MTPKDKITLVQLFLRGQGVKDLAIFFACTEQSVQRVLRESIQQLANLNGRIGQELRERRAADDAQAEPEPAVQEL